MLAVDDSPLTGSSVACVGVVARTDKGAGQAVEGLLVFRVTKDGSDSTDELLRAVTRSRFKQQLKAVLVHSVTLAGLNILDLPRLSGELGIPVLAVTKRAPKKGELTAALAAAHQRGKIKLVKKAGETHEHKGNYFHCAGIGPAEAGRLLERFGGYPWPLRLAHLVATALARGESRGRA